VSGLHHSGRLRPVRARRQGAVLPDRAREHDGVRRRASHAEL